MGDDKTLAMQSFREMMDGIKGLSKTARARIEAAHYAAVRKARDEAEAACVPEESVKAVSRAAEYGARVGYLAALRDCASELQRHGGEAQEAAQAALDAVREEVIEAPVWRLSRAAVRAAQASENAVRGEMYPRAENRATWSGPNPLAKMAEAARDAAKSDGGIKVLDASVNTDGSAAVDGGEVKR